jgi:hypothetical protein
LVRIADVEPIEVWVFNAVSETQTLTLVNRVRARARDRREYGSVHVVLGVLHLKRHSGEVEVSRRRWLDAAWICRCDAAGLVVALDAPIGR